MYDIHRTPPFLPAAALRRAEYQCSLYEVRPLWGGPGLVTRKGENHVLKSCRYCGRIHPKGYICPKKPKPAPHRNGKIAGFRKTYAWQKKRDQIVRRDFHLCRVCNEGSYGVFGVPGLESNLSVHHIEPLEERFDLRLDEGNLLTCCDGHHRMADDGDIPRDYLHDLAQTSPRWG